jgi:hypothetical protein
MTQIVGSASEIILFLSGFFLGKELIVIAVSLFAARMLTKILISELMYKRMKAVIREETN